MRAPMANRCYRVGRSANHSCRPNAESALVKGKVMLRAIKPIAAGEEISDPPHRPAWDNASQCLDLASSFMGLAASRKCSIKS